jgi:demethylmenaquinone methyltransferase / 2-methoxy-6-polyprenyl-1,4-benzoquinol methylase
MSTPRGPERPGTSPDAMAAMFDAIVPRYRTVNRILSFGLDQRWRRLTAKAARVRPGDRVLDLGCGEGDLGLLTAGVASVTGVDVSTAMLRSAQQRAEGRLKLVRASAGRLPFTSATFDVAMSAFVLRNLDDLPAALAELGRVLRPGGRLALVDITGPRLPAARWTFDAYFGLAAPLLGRLVGQRDAYRYLPRSVARLPDNARLVAMLTEAGFEHASSRPLTGGVVTLFAGTRGGR